MYRSNFRVKLDLGKFYNDVRRYCWIFIDSSKMLEVTHLMEHITKLLNIKETFHLLLNNTEYLPPNEDIRIVKENETILVCPGSGLENGSEFSMEYTIEDRNISMKQERNTSTVQNKESQTIVSPPQCNTTAVQTLSNDVEDKSQTESSEISAISHGREDSDVSSMVESKTTDATQMEDFIITENLQPKRKRVRHRKKKTQQAEKNIPQKNENKSRKPKIIETCIVSSGKHIRFDNLDNEEVIGNDVVYTKTINGSNVKISPSHELANLLSLGRHSTPLTFTSTKVKQEVKTEHMSDEELQINPSSANTNKNATVNNKVPNGTTEIAKDLLSCPIMRTKPQLKDVIAFKMLKIGSDYTPQVSDFIVAEVVSYCPKTSVYTFRVLQGLSEVQVPVGKFTLVQDEEEHVMNDTITVNYAQIMEPRLVSSSNANTSVPSVN